MNRKHYLLPLILAFLLPILQVNGQDVRWIPYLSVDYDLARIDPVGLNNFYSSFNSFWGSRLATPFEEITGDEFSHPNFGFGMRVLFGEKAGYTANFFFSRGNNTYSQEAIWENGIKNETLLKFKDWTFGFGQGVHINRFLFVDVHMTGYARNMYLEYATIFQDGSRSITPEYRLNGIYPGLVSELHWGGSASVQLGAFTLYTRASLPIRAFLKSSKFIVTLDDFDTPHFPPSDFPMDYGLWATDPISFVEQDQGLKADYFAGPRLVFGIRLSPNFSSNK